MCHMFEKVAGKKSKGDVTGLRMLLSEALLSKKKHVIINVPVEIM